MKRGHTISDFLATRVGAAARHGVHAALACSERLGPRTMLSLGRLFGRCAGSAWPWPGRLRQCLRGAGVQPTDERVRRYFRLLGTWAGWSLAVYQHGFDGSGVGDQVRLDESVTHLDRALAGGHGALLLTAHFFCYDMGAALIHRRHPMTSLVREGKDPARHALKQRWYRALGIDVVQRARRESGLADSLQYLRVLRQGKSLAITPDLLVPPDKGTPVTMFGRTVCLPAGAIRLALAAKAPVVPVWGEWDFDPRGRPVRFNIHFGEPLEIRPTRDREAAVRAGMHDVARFLESRFRHSPEAWMFWLDKRWSRLLHRPPDGGEEAS